VEAGDTGTHTGLVSFSSIQRETGGWTYDEMTKLIANDAGG
jgi:hypothetical protein